jgi:hypothetical protein
MSTRLPGEANVKSSVEVAGGYRNPSFVGRVTRTLTLVLPSVLLALVGVNLGGQLLERLALGSGVLLFLAGFVALSPQVRRAPPGTPVVAVYLVALIWLWVCTAGFNDWLPHLVQAVLLVVPLILYAAHTLTASGAPAYRRARHLARRLHDRTSWPAELSACRTLPEVKALREAIQVEPAPALELLTDPRPQVRLAALAALEFRKHWPGGQPEMMLKFARLAPEPLVRAAAVMALGNVDRPGVIEGLAVFLTDPALEVRQAAAEALLWDCERRWVLVRPGVYAALADPRFAGEGPLAGIVGTLPTVAVSDLAAWTAEGGSLSVRATHTLTAHYHRALQSADAKDLPEQLRGLVESMRTPITLRIDLAHLLQEYHLLDSALLEKLLDPAEPCPLRLLAAESLLDHGPNQVAQDTLREIARNPNRELALTTASIVQRCLGVDFGLPNDGPPPPLQSRQAAEVTRRVMLWAAQSDSPSPEPVTNKSSASSADWVW